MIENAEQKLELNLIKPITYTRIMETIKQIDESPKYYEYKKLFEFFKRL